MNTTELLHDIINSIGYEDLEVQELLVSGNMIKIEGAITIENLSEDVGYDYDYRVTAYESVEHYNTYYTAKEALIKEFKKIKNFKSGDTVMKGQTEFMLVPNKDVLGTFYLLDVESHRVRPALYSGVELYEEGFTLLGGNKDD